MAGYDACRRKHVAGDIAVGVYAAVDALGDVDNNHTALYRRADCVEEPRPCRAVARAIRAQNDTFDIGSVEQMAQHILIESREEIDSHHVAVELVARLERAGMQRVREGVAVVLYAEAYLGKVRIIVAFESIEIIGAALGGAVAAP